MAAAVCSGSNMASKEMSFGTRPNSIFGQSDRPISTYTDILEDEDWEDTGSDGGSIFEEDSPRGSFDSITTVEEANTPVDKFKNAQVEIKRRPSTKGPLGPHLFRSSFQPASEDEFQDILQLSPLLPKGMLSIDQIVVDSPMTVTQREKTTGSGSQQSIVRTWTTKQVVDWMFAAGFDSDTIDRFEEHEINGDVLLDMQLKDLKELGIAAFGQRVSVWNTLAILREDGSISPAATLFEDTTRSANTPSESTRRHERKKSRGRKDDCGSETPSTPSAPRRYKVRRTNRTAFNDPLTPAESISIVAIEQLLPKPHKCAKGKDCPKHKRQERLRQQIAKENAISPADGGQIWITGYFDDFGGQNGVEDGLRGAEPSLVASSDLLLGTAEPPEFSMDKEMQRQIAKHEAQDSVKQYLTLQHVRTGSVDTPPTPPLETPQFNSMREAVPTPRFAPAGPATPPPMPTPMVKLQELPKLSIPRSASAGPDTARSARSARSPYAPRSSVIQRRASPASMNDLPLRNLTLTPVARDMSRSVQANMHFRPPVARRASQSPSTWQRASFRQPLQGIPEYSIPGVPPMSPIRSPIRVSPRIAYGAGTTHVGYMRKRRTKLLRHEWNLQHCRLQGTILSMHASGRSNDKQPLEAINIHDFTVACSSLSTDTKLAAALKVLKIKSDKKEAGLHDAAFVFQLIPASDRGKVLTMLKDMKNGGSKTHHFAVKSRDERIDWMREVMLAKAKGEGYEVTIL